MDTATAAPTTLAASRVRRFLEKEPVVWLSTVRPDGNPHLVPIWFWWDGEAVLVFSKPNAQKVRNLRANPSVMLALGDAEEDFDVGMLRGRAELAADPYRGRPAGRIPRQVFGADRGTPTVGRRICGDLQPGRPDRPERLPRVARPNDAAKRADRRCASRLDRRAAATERRRVRR